MTVYGIDVSSAQGVIPQVQWQAVAIDKKFVYNEAQVGNDGPVLPGGGRNGTCATFDENVAGQRAAGLVIGAYLFCECLPDDPEHPGRDPESQVQFFFEASGGLGGAAGELPPALDFEDPPPEKWAADGISPAFLEDWSGRAVDKTKSLWGVLPVVYGYPWWFNQARLTSVGGCKLWLAAYGGSTIRMVYPWNSTGTQATILQVGNGTGSLAYRLPNGAPCDENVVEDSDFTALLVR